MRRIQNIDPPENLDGPKRLLKLPMVFEASPAKERPFLRCGLRNIASRE